MPSKEHLRTRLDVGAVGALDASARKVTEHIAHRKHISRNVARELELPSPSLGQRAADAVAAFGGSWTFVLLFFLTMLVWMGLNTALLVLRGHVRSLPYILLNLVLSMLAAIQAPIILMSQNRQSEKDRIRGEHDYEVNLKAELEIMLLHEKLDDLQQKQWSELIGLQREQLRLLTVLVEQNDRR
jgi:uncharacterized membrane protein